MLRNRLALATLLALGAGAPAADSRDASWDKVKALVGEWEGKYGVNPEGGTLTGTLNPGPDAVPMKNIKLTPPPGGVANADAPWELHFEADSKDEAGAPVKVVVDGFMENIGAYKRFITGTWQQGARKGPFRVIANYGL